MSAVDVTIPFERGVMSAAIARPNDGLPRHPGVVVAHDLLGLSQDMRRIAEKLAADGYVAVAPDLYSPGVRPLCIAVTFWALAHDRNRPVEQLEAARWLADQPDVDNTRIGAIGFCMGGGFALLLGTRGDLGAVSINYGQVPKTIERLEGICPVVASYGANDQRFIPDAHRLEAFLEKLAVPHDMHIYDSAAHSFMNKLDHPRLVKALHPTGSYHYDCDASDDAWRRILAFFEHHLQTR